MPVVVIVGAGLCWLEVAGVVTGGDVVVVAVDETAVVGMSAIVCNVCFLALVIFLDSLEKGCFSLKYLSINNEIELNKRF